MPRLTADANFTTARLDDLFDDCQPRTCAMPFAIRPIQRVNQTRQRITLSADA